MNNTSAEAMNPANERLIEHIEFMFWQITVVNTDYTLLKKIGEYADSINYKDYGSLFVTFQDSLIKNVELGLARLLEDRRKEGRYTFKKLFSKIETEYAQFGAVIISKETLQYKLRDAGMGPEEAVLDIIKLPDKDIVDWIVEAYRNHLQTNPAIVAVREYVMTRKDKVHSHNDKVRAIEGITYEQLDKAIYQLGVILSCLKGIIQGIGALIDYDGTLHIEKYTAHITERWERLTKVMSFTTQTEDEIEEAEQKAHEEWKKNFRAPKQ